MEIKQLKQVEVVTDVVCDVCNQSTKLGGVSKSMLTLNEAIIDVKKG